MNTLQTDCYGTQRKYGDTSKIDEQKWIKYFTQLYSTGTLEENENEDVIGMRLEVKGEDVIEFVRNLRNRKSSVEDTITNEILKYGSHRLFKNNKDDKKYF
jgi:hypothetical protein